MLKKIDAADLRLGMHLHALEASWPAPFWHTGFAPADRADVVAACGSVLSHCRIDFAKGLDVVSSPHRRTAGVDPGRAVADARLGEAVKVQPFQPRVEEFGRSGASRGAE